MQWRDLIHKELLALRVVLRLVVLDRVQDDSLLDVPAVSQLGDGFGERVVGQLQVVV